METNIQNIALYIFGNINLFPNQVYTIWVSPNGMCHTKGSHEYREDTIQEILSFSTMDEVPDTFEEVKRSVTYQLKSQAK